MTALAGQLLTGRYRIEGRAGRGGVAEVFRAFDEREQRLVALGCLMRQDNPRTQERLFTLFRHEFSILTQVAHPNVVQVYDFGFADGLPYYTMELLDGADLDKSGPACRGKRCARCCVTWRRRSRSCTRAAWCIATCRRATCAARRRVAPS